MNLASYFTAPIAVDAAGSLGGRLVAERMTSGGSPMPEPADLLGAYAGAAVWTNLLNARFGTVAGSSMPAELLVKSLALVAIDQGVKRVMGEPMASSRRLMFDVLGTAGGLVAAAQVAPML
jgi:hypothetical protein